MVQVNLCQKLLFLHQLTHNMTTDCSLSYNFNAWKFEAQTWGEHIVFWMSKTISCSELGIFMYWTCNSMNNLSSYCGIVDAKIRASDKNLHVLALLTSFLRITGCFFVKRFCWITCLVCVVYIKLFWISKQKRLFVKSNPIYNWHSMQTYRT